jgi:hypothetical protein
MVIAYVSLKLETDSFLAIMTRVLLTGSPRARVFLDRNRLIEGFERQRITAYAWPSSCRRPPWRAPLGAPCWADCAC